MKIKNIFIFFVVFLLVACKKHDILKVEQHTELKEWLKQNGEGYKNGVLQFKGANGEIKTGQLNWSQVKTYDIDGIVYTEVPFMFGEENKGEFRSNNSDTKVDAAFYLMFRMTNGKLESAIKVVQQNLELKANSESKTGTIESFRNLKNELVNIWFRESINKNPIALKLAESQNWANAISSQNDLKSNSCDISYTVVRVITGGGVSPDSSPDNVIVYSVYAETTMFKIDCAGSGSGSEYWPPTPPPSSAGGGPEQPKKDPCPISLEELKAVFLGKKIDTSTLKSVISLINKYGDKFGFDNPYKIKHFLAQIAHESGGLTTIKKTESAYFSAKTLLSKFGRYFSSDPVMWDKGKKNPDEYVGNPEKIANLVYGKKNGNKYPGDGWMFIGRGPIQLTGRDNYTAFQNFYNNLFPNKQLDFINHPELVNSTDEIAMLASMWWCKENLWWQLKWNASTSPFEVSGIINHYDKAKEANGIDDRLQYFNKVNQSIDCDN